MALDADLIADRRQLRRKLTLWRVLAVLALIVATVVGGLVATGGTARIGDARPQIARISVGGFIAGDQRMSDLFKRVASTSSISGVVISINSPGGTTTGSEELFRGIRELAGAKPLVAFIDGTAASGGYITALAADRIVARETSIVGSIGVLFQYPELSKLLGQIGVSVEEVKSSPLKAEPSPFRQASPEARAALQAVVNDTYTWFKALVGDRRGMSDTELAAVSDGRIFSGRQAVPLKLIDEIGGEREAIAWLEREKGVARNLPVRDWKPRTDQTFPLWSALAFGVHSIGLEPLASAMRSGAFPGTIGVDGLLALWQPPGRER